MHEHIHLLIHTVREYSIANIVRSLNQPLAQFALAKIQYDAPVLAKRLAVVRNGKTCVSVLADRRRIRQKPVHSLASSALRFASGVALVDCEVVFWFGLSI